MEKSNDRIELTPSILLRAYSIGIFPMAQSRTDTMVHWVCPSTRCVLPLEQFHIPRRLKRTIRHGSFQVRFNTAFANVLKSCAAPRPSHPETWINPEIERVFCQLHEMGFAHSVEAWRDETLAGGLYGLAIGGAFFGESMFSSVRDASKVALVHLFARLKFCGFSLLDAQFMTEHLKQFGAIEISDQDYSDRLGKAIRRHISFYSDISEEDVSGSLDSALTQSSTQTS